MRHVLQLKPHMCSAGNFVSASRSKVCQKRCPALAAPALWGAGQLETVILRKLAGADPEGKRHCVRLLRTFEYRHHLCLVFESMVRLPPLHDGGVCVNCNTILA